VPSIVCTFVKNRLPDGDFGGGCKSCSRERIMTRYGHVVQSGEPYLMEIEIISLNYSSSFLCRHVKKKKKKKTRYGHIVSDTQQPIGLLKWQNVISWIKFG
jgi:hypothetical protein